MENSFIQLNDLPDEILLTILKKLPNTDVLYSLIGVNKRLDTIVKDSIFTRYLTLMTPCNDLSRITEPILNRFCVEILSEIRHKILWLNLELSSMDRILLSTNYPNLLGLALHKLIPEKASELFTGKIFSLILLNNESYFIRTFKNQLSSIVIDIDINECPKSTSSIKDINIFIFTQIFKMFKNLQYFKFNPFDDSHYDRLTFRESRPNILSSTLLVLRVVVDFYEDCLYLLDGRFNQLNTIYVTICSSKVPTLPVVNNKKKLPNLKCFSLTHSSKIISYIDGFPQLNQFHCHIYSYPYSLTHYNYITNNFRGGLFKHVCKISLVDERPFEHEFFLQIAKSFPFVRELRIHNREPQNNDKQQCSIIEYPHLTKLVLTQSHCHENYLEQFLNSSKMYLSNNIYLIVDYDSLQRVTDNFTSDTTRMNCAKIKYLNLDIQPELSLDLIKDYFPCAELC
ncbi:unnamed protein product [Rotaria socialis]|uniref:F-box domain-containing protein n=1 Tax=Rotaria socialis TaxID=392032 RepID=A0A817SH62_9BILA|nr:unnamed protein product [Rotaria socialis]